MRIAKSDATNKVSEKVNTGKKKNYLIMADDDDVKEYRWETGYEKTWEEIREDKEGELSQG